MNTLPPPAEPEAARPLPVLGPDPWMSPGELFLRVFVMAAGIGLGAILALFVGLATGWIPFVC